MASADHRAHAHRDLTVWAGLALALLLGAVLRVGAARHSEVVDPIASDAKEYFWYAHNLKAFGVHARRPPTNPPAPPAPDSLRPPGYPLFVALLTDHPASAQSLGRVVMAQALIGIAVVLLAFLAARGIVGPRWALLPAWLTAASPHLVNAGIYLLTETLFSLALVALLAVLARRDLERRLGWLFLAGAITGAAALVRPTADFLPLALLALLFLRWPRRTALRAGAALLAGFVLLVAPWAARNAALPPNDQLKINMLHHGMYPDFTYEGVPESYGVPYRYDPRSPQIGSSMEAVTAEILRRFSEEPRRHLEWYLLDKPVELWSWYGVQGVGGTFVYGVRRSPYFDSALFQATEFGMLALHWACVLLAAALCVAVWVPRVQGVLAPGALLPAQACAMLLMYVTALHMVGFPDPRYATPFRPELYIGATAGLLLLAHAIRVQLRRRAEGIR